MGQIHGSWGGLALHEYEDSYEILKSWFLKKFLL
jgi:hypothetical protein